MRIVWSQLVNEDGSRTKPRLILSTDISLPAARIILNYGRRWAVEDLFNQLKNRWGWKETWQQTRQVLHRWVQILSVSYAIPQLLVLFKDAKIAYLASFAPWRQKQPNYRWKSTAGAADIFWACQHSGHVEPEVR